MIDETDLKDYAAGDVRATSRDGQEMAREIIRLRTEAKILSDALQELIDLVENEPEANDPAEELFIAVHAAKVALDPAQVGMPPRPSTDVQRTEPSE